MCIIFTWDFVVNDTFEITYNLYFNNKIESRIVIFTKGILKKKKNEIINLLPFENIIKIELIKVGHAIRPPLLMSYGGWIILGKQCICHNHIEINNLNNNYFTYY